MTNSNNSTGCTITLGPGFLGMLTVLFIGLKLTHYIDWSWWWVLGPLWIPWAVVLVVLASIGVIYVFILAVITLIESFTR